MLTSTTVPALSSGPLSRHGSVCRRQDPIGELAAIQRVAKSQDPFFLQLVDYPTPGR
jgi:hypothetical protein